MQTTTRAIQGEPMLNRAKREPTKLLSMYSAPPSAEITLEEFELCALDRLQVLRTIESLRLRGVRGEEYKNKLDDVLRISLPMTMGSPEEVRKDQISHFILRLAYCRTEDLRRWFLNFESMLFRFRLERLDANERAKFMEENNVSYDMVSKEDVARLRAQLQAIPIPNFTPGQSSNTNFTDVTRTQFFRIPFTQALDLVQRREVFLERGFAYVPMERLVSIIVARFRTQLSKGLLDALHSFPYILADTRIAPMVQNMSKQYTGKDFSKIKGEGNVSIDDLDTLADRSFPLCMKELHRVLKTTHKLKHEGRLQYTLYLKGVGLSMEENLQFWEREFTKIMTAEQFTKNYAYNIRHAYGKEGKRKDYTPKDCRKIVLLPAPQGDQAHGCPYKHYDEGHISRLLERMKIGSNERDDVLKYTRGGHPQLACQRLFELTHKGAETLINMEGVGNHPNAYFAASMAYYKALNKDKDTSKAEGMSQEGSQAESGSQEAAPMEVEEAA